MCSVSLLFCYNFLIWKKRLGQNDMQGGSRKIRRCAHINFIRSGNLCDQIKVEEKLGKRHVIMLSSLPKS